MISAVKLVGSTALALVFLASCYTEQKLTRNLAVSSHESFSKHIDLSEDETVGYVHPSVIYGHIHIAKTTGTILNGLLASKYERVCGHKGYSFDFVQANKRRVDQNASKPNVNIVGDAISSIHHKYNRGRVPTEIMIERGFEDCDWISHEERWKIWKQFAAWNETIELHVPCRDPIEHLMSICNHKKVVFDCSKNPVDEIARCISVTNRFSFHLDDIENIQLKCYDSEETFTKYLPYIEHHLQPKRKATEYTFLSTNLERNREAECIWNDTVVRQTTLTHLMGVKEYYRFCRKCVGSANDLFSMPPWTQSV